jgi:hypothetical protein
LKVTSAIRGSLPGVGGELDEYTAGVLHSPYRVVLKNINPNRHVTTVLGFDSSGKEVKKVEFTFSRNGG